MGRLAIPIAQFARRLFASMPDSPALVADRLPRAWQQFTVLLLAGLVLRGATFGNPNLHLDDSFYLLVGLQMHDGLLPYVDIWDRKPIGLFFIYYLFTAMPDPVLAYEIAAWLFAASTAMVIGRIARLWTNPQGGLFAGLTYLLVLPLFEGWGGQSPVFYNLFIATAALLLLRDSERLRAGSPGWQTYGAMALGGLALIIKQITICEVAFLGLYAAWLLRPTTLRKALHVIAWMVIGAAPTLAVAIAYHALGHWAEYWQAMVTANLTKGALPTHAVFMNLLKIVLRLYPLLTMAIAGIMLCERNQRGFLVGWLVAAFLGMAIVPNFYTHYALPLIVPLSVASALVLQRRDLGLFALGMTACFSAVIYNPFNFIETYRSRHSLAHMAESIRKHDSGGGLFISDGPVGLYALSGKKPLSPLAFPPHLVEWIERDTAIVPTDQAVDEILARKPGVVAIAAIPSSNLSNGHTRKKTLAYVRQNCRHVDRQTSWEVVQKATIDIYGDCRR